MIGMIVLFDALSYWVFDTQIGWGSMLMSALISGAFTVVFFHYRAITPNSGR